MAGETSMESVHLMGTNERLNPAKPFRDWCNFSTSLIHENGYDRGKTRAPLDEFIDRGELELYRGMDDLAIIRRILGQVRAAGHIVSVGGDVHKGSFLENICKSLRIPFHKIVIGIPLRAWIAIRRAAP